MAKYYNYIDTGNDDSKVGFGMSLGKIAGVSGYISSDYEFGINVQSSRFVYGIGVGRDEGVSGSFGINYGNTTKEFTISIGWFTIGLATAAAAIAVIALTPAPGARVAAAVAGCLLLFFCLYNGGIKNDGISYC